MQIQNEKDFLTDSLRSVRSGDVFKSLSCSEVLLFDE